MNRLPNNKLSVLFWQFLPGFAGPPVVANGEQTRTVRPPPMVIVMADHAGCSGRIVAELAAMNIPAIIRHHPLEAIDALVQPCSEVAAVFMSLQDRRADVVAFFAFLASEYPHIRRIAFAQHEARYENDVALQSCLHDMVLWDAWHQASFRRDLRDAVLRDDVVKSTWSDKDLIESSRLVNNSARDIIIGRYRHRIAHLTLDAARNQADAEDMSQDACLNIVRRLPGFHDQCSPAEWIDRVTRQSISRFLDSATADRPPT